MDLGSTRCYQWPPFPRIELVCGGLLDLLSCVSCPLFYNVSYLQLAHLPQVSGVAFSRSYSPG